MYRTNPPKSLFAVAFMGTCFAIIRAALFLAAKILPGPQDLSDDPGQLLLIGLNLGQHAPNDDRHRSEEHTSELQSLMRTSYAVFCLKKKKQKQTTQNNYTN